MRYRLQRHDGTDCSATMVPITVLRMVPIQRYRHNGGGGYRGGNNSRGGGYGGSRGDNGYGGGRNRY